MPAQVTRLQAVDFYTIQLSRLADGALFVEMIATTVDEKEPVLLSQEIANERVLSIDDALIVIRNAAIGA